MSYSNSSLQKRTPIHLFILLLAFGPLVLDAQSFGCGFGVEGQEPYTTEIGVPGSGMIGGTALTASEVIDIRGQYNDQLQIIIPPRSRSESIRFAGFGFQLPEYGHVSGLKLSMMRYAEGSSEVKDIRIMLNHNGQLIGNDKSTQTYSGDWTTMSPWVLGNNMDSWGLDNITPAMVNSSDFGIELQLKNGSDEEVTVFLDQIMLQVYYQEVIDICGHPCITATIEDLDEANTYTWSASPELRIEAAGDHLDLLNVFADDMAYGLYELCLNTQYPDGSSSLCCRSVRYSECEGATIGDYVWNDMNGNGLQDADEKGLDEVRVNLFDDSYVLMDVQHTDNGHYSFTDVRPGNYFVQADIDGYELTGIADNDDLNSDGEGIYLPGSTRMIKVNSEEVIENIDFGFRQDGRICGTVWEDADINNLLDQGETGIENVTVELLDANMDVIATQLTDLDGGYCFHNIMRDNYWLRFIGIDGNTVTSFRGLSISNARDEYEVVYDIDESSLGNDIGVARMGSIGDRVWIDSNNDGIMDPSELPVGNVIVRLKDCAGNQVASIVTNNEGRYVFTEVIAGEYIVELDLTDPDYNVLTDYGPGVCFELEAGEDKTDVDFRLVPSQVVLSASQWVDENEDGVYQLTESAIGGAIVELYNCNGDLVDFNDTDFNGQVSFLIDPGEYYLKFEGQEGLDFINGNHVSHAYGEGSTDCIVVDADYQVYGRMVPEETYTIRASLWIDEDMDVLFDFDEVAVAGTEVTLTDCNTGTVINVLTSFIDGTVSFNDIPAGTYFLTAAEVPGQQFGLVSDFSNANGPGTSDCFTVIDSDLAFGLTYEPVQVVRRFDLAGRVWLDEDDNGLIGNTESGMADVEVRLYDENFQMIDTVMTTSTGSYMFQDKEEGSYLVQFMKPQDYMFSEYRAGIMSDLDSEILFTATGMTDTIILNTDQLHINAGLVPEVQIEVYSISGTVWEDVDRDGLLVDGEPVLENGTVNLFDATGRLVDITTTDLYGWYRFSDVPVGEYIIRFRLPDDAIATTYRVDMGSDLDSELLSNGDSDVIQLIDKDITGVNAGYYFAQAPSYSIAGTLWEDTDQDGILMDGEPVMEGQEIRLFNEQGVKIATTYTDIYGWYIFQDLQPAEYKVIFNIPEDAVVTLFKAEPTSDFDSEILADGRTEAIVITDQDVHGVNAGYYYPQPDTYSIAGTLWNDTDRDGLLEDGEPVMEGKEVRLFNELGVKIATTYTDIYGWYIFQNLESADYKVLFNIPEGAQATIFQVDNSSDFDSEMGRDGLTETISITDQDVHGVNGGYYYPQPASYSIAGTLWEDTDRDGLLEDGEPVMEGEEVRLFNDLGVKMATSYTDIYGWYIFEDLEPGDYKVIFDIPEDAEVTTFMADPSSDFDSEIDSDGRTETIVLIDQNVHGVNAGYYFDSGSYDISGTVWEDDNGDGLIESAELDADGIQVELLTESGDIIEFTDTDRNGDYNFSDLSPGDYQVRFNLPIDVEVTAYQVDGSTDVDSEIESLNSPISVVINNQDVTGVNAGYYYPVGLGDYIWLDINSDGIQDSNEEGANDQTINLMSEERDFLESTRSGVGPDGENGYYYFSGLRPGNYYVQIRGQRGVAFSPSGVGNESEDSDLDNSLGYGTTSIISLRSGEEYYDLDLGLILEPGVIGDRVWVDENKDGVQDPSETGINDIVVELYDLNGDLYQSTVTGSEGGEDGYYLFEDVFPTQYFIKIYPPTNYVSTTSDQGGVDANDSDINHSNGPNTSSYFDLSPAESDLDIDAGIYFNPAPIRDGGRNMKTVTYPNPARDVMSVMTSIPFESADVRLEVMDASGRKVIEKEIENISRSVATSFDMPVDELTEGVYILRVSVGTRTELLRFIKVKF